LCIASSNAHEVEGFGPGVAFIKDLWLTYITEYKEAFALFDKRGTGAVPRETLGDLLRALGQNPTQAEVADIVANAPRDGTRLLCSMLINSDVHVLIFVFVLVGFHLASNATFHT